MRAPSGAFLDPVVVESLRITTIGKDTSVYIEIYRRLRRLIESGVLKAGDPLPSESALSSIMCVGRTSLRTALSILYEDGYIETVRGKGSCVTGDGRKEKHRRNFPSEILLPPERIALLGDVRVADGRLEYVRGDDFLTDKLAPAPGKEILQFQQMYYLNEKPAVLSFYYFVNDLFPVALTDSLDKVYSELAAALSAKTVTAEYECLPIRSSKPSGLQRLLPRGMQTLVTTQYIGSNGIVAFCKDYYNTEVMRFRFALRK